jgi:hypothetical protein
MTILSQIPNGVEPQRQKIDRRATIRRLVAAMRAAERALRESIKEEERTCIREPDGPALFGRCALDARAGG